MPTRKITIQSCAKLNLILKVLNTRPDGFHNIQSIFQTIDLEDQLSLTQNTIRALVKKLEEVHELDIDGDGRVG